MTHSHEAGASQRCTGLGRVTDLGPEDFAETWGRGPRYVAAAALPSAFDDLLDTRDVDALLSRHGLRAPFLRVARDGRTLADSEFTRGGGVGAGVSDQLDDTALLRLFADGHTLVLQGLHRTHPPVLAFAQDLSADLGHPVQVNAYVTPAQSRGFAAHYDVHDVFVLQTGGDKLWHLHAPVHPHPLRDQPWQDHREAVSEAAQRDPDLEVTLHPGDVLSIPRGWLHSATALGEVSTHLTVGVHVWHRGHVAEAVIDSARRALAASPAQRSPLRPGIDVADPEDLTEDLEAVRAALLEAIAAIDGSEVADRLARRQRAAHRPAPIDPIATMQALAEGLEGRSLLPREHLLATIEPAAEGAVLVSRAGRVQLTEPEADAVTDWLAGEAAAPLDPPLARRLVIAGVATIDPGPPA